MRRLRWLNFVASFLGGYRWAWAPVLVAWVGLSFAHTDTGLVGAIGSWLRLRSIDDLFVLRHFIARPEVPGTLGVTPEVAIVFIDPPLTNDWQSYAQLVTNLTGARAAAIVFDINFYSRAWSRDEAKQGLLTSLTNFLNAAHRPKLVFATRGTNQVVSTGGTAYTQARQIGPFDELRDFIDSHTNSCALGLMNSTQSSDTIVREYRPNLGFNSDCLAAVAARLIDRKDQPKSVPPAFFLNYYGPAGTLPLFTNVVFADALVAARLGGKVVFVGSSQDPADLHRHAFSRNPYSLCYSNLFTGVEIQATAFLNLVTPRAGSSRNSGTGDWIVAADLGFERTALISFGVVLGIVFSFLSFADGTLAALFFAVLAAAISCCFMVTDNVVLPWWIAAGPQVFCALLIPAIPVKSVFISHRTADGQTLAGALTQRFRWLLGIRVYFGQEDPMSGVLTPRLKARVRQYKNFLLLITDDLCRASTPFIDAEIAEAMASGRNIIPMIVVRSGSSRAAMEAIAMRRWRLPADLRFVEYEERTGWKQISEIGYLLEWGFNARPSLCHHVAKSILRWCRRPTHDTGSPTRENTGPNEQSRG